MLEAQRWTRRECILRLGRLESSYIFAARYTISFTRYFTNCKRATVLSAEARPYKKDPRVDAAMNATLQIETDEGDIITSEIYNDLDEPNLFGIIPRVWELPSIQIELEKATIYYYK